MAGHSQFKNIMHKKGRADKARSKLFGKLAREITVAAKLGMPDPAFNPRLRAAILAARAENMPKDNIERAIKKSQGADTESYDEIRYEGYGPGGVAVIVEALTDNRNRTAGEVRAIFAKNGGNLAETGAVSFMVARAPGVGQKVAERIVTELKDKAPAFANIDPAVVHLAGALDEKRAPRPVADAVSALINLGYGHPQAAAAIAAAARNAGEGADTATLIRQGLKELAR